MMLLLNKNSLYSTFGVQDFDSLESAVGSMAPSMVEYYLSDLSNGNDDSYLNRRNIQKSLDIGEYSLYIDYDDEIYLEIDTAVSSDDFETASLW